MSKRTPLETAQLFLRTLATPGFFQDLGSPGFEAWTSLVAEDAIIRFPATPPGMPEFCQGRAAWKASIMGAFGAIGSFSWAELELHATDDPELVMGVGKGDAVAANGRPYKNSYCFYFRVRDGEIMEYREFFNPLVMMESFAP